MPSIIMHSFQNNTEFQSYVILPLSLSSSILFSALNHTLHLERTIKVSLTFNWQQTYATTLLDMYEGASLYIIAQKYLRHKVLRSRYFALL